MKNFRLLNVLCAGYVSLVSTSISAALVDRDGGLIYDEDRDITWMQNAFAIPRVYKDDGRFNLDATLMSRTEAMGWVDALDFGGFTDWRLPSTLNVDLSNADFSCDQDNRSRLTLNLNPCAGGEMGHLVFDEGLEWDERGASDSSLTPRLSFGSLGLFDNVYGGGYWTSEDYEWDDQEYEDAADAKGADARNAKEGFGWLYYFDGGGEETPGGYKTILATHTDRAVWAVRDGDVLAAVPVPAAVWLFGSGLLGLAGLARRKG